MMRNQKKISTKYYKPKLTVKELSKIKLFNRRNSYLEKINLFATSANWPGR